MKTIHLFCSAALAAVALTSCHSSDEPKTPKGEDIAVELTMKNAAESGSTRQQGASASTKVDLKNGTLVFVDKNSKITKVVKVDATANAFDSTNQTVGIDAIKGGALVTGVPVTSVNAYFISNTTNTFAVGENMVDKKIGINTQYSSDGSVSGVTFSGINELTPKDETGEAADKYTVSITVKSVVNRIEIGKITGTHTSGDATKMTYKVGGIFINKYLQRLTYGGIHTDNVVTDNGTLIANYAEGKGSYLTGNKGIVFDVDAAGMVVDGAKVWAYNLLAPRINNNTTTGFLPSIVIRLEDVVVNGVKQGTQFLTYTKFFDANNAEIKQIKAGDIWALNEIKFNETDLTIAPGVDSKSVKVNISVVDWNKTQVSVGY